MACAACRMPHNTMQGTTKRQNGIPGYERTTIERQALRVLRSRPLQDPEDQGHAGEVRGRVGRRYLVRIRHEIGRESHWHRFRRISSSHRPQEVSRREMVECKNCFNDWVSQSARTGTILSTITGILEENWNPGSKGRGAIHTTTNSTNARTPVVEDIQGRCNQTWADRWMSGMPRHHTRFNIQGRAYTRVPNAIPRPTQRA